MVTKEYRTGISYCRKSVTVKGDVEEQSNGVDYQQETINKYAGQHGITIVRQYQDIGYSGKDIERPDLQKMLEDIKTVAKPIDCLLLYSVDRLGRDLAGNVGLMTEISKYVKMVIYVADGITSNSNFFKIFFLMHSGEAQSERIRLARRTSDGRKAKVIGRKSFNGSQLPLGYVIKQVPVHDIIQTIHYNCIIGVEKLLIQWCERFFTA